MENKRTHQYPKTRKPRDITYSKSYKLLQAVGEERLREYFSKAGMYIVSKQLTELLGYYVTPAVVRYCRDRYKLGRTHEEKDNL